MSLGREGPTVQMGAAVGALVGRLLRLRQRAMPQLISAGAGAGLAAAFNAPLAGFIFVLEELQRELSPLTYGGALVAAVCADIVTRWMSGQGPSLRVDAAVVLPLSVLPLIGVVGVLAGLGGVAFNIALVRASNWMDARRRVPGWLRTGIAAALVAMVAWWLPDAVGGGHPVAERLGTGWYAAVGLTTLALLLVAKFATTVLSYASGAPGGIFAPMLVLGALIGLLVQRVTVLAWPGLADLGPAFAVLGMAAFFASSVRAPLTGIVLILEMTGDYQLLFPLSAACLVAYLMAEMLRDRPVYDALLERDLARSGFAGPGPEPTNVTIGIQHDSAAAGRTIREVGFPPGCLVVGVERRGRSLLPTAGTRLEPGDHITVLVPGESPDLAVRVVELCRIA
jgi:CIC family chloride channel protein